MMDLQRVAKKINKMLNPGKGPKTTGFTLLVFGYDAPGIANYVSTGERNSMIQHLRDTADRLERRDENTRVPFRDDP